MKELIKQKYHELNDIRIKENALILEVNDILNQYITENSEFKVGDMVNVVETETEKVLGTGCVTEVTTKLRIDPFSTKYTVKDDSFDDHISKFIYKVAELKKDGTPSSKLFNRHLGVLTARGEKSSYHIEKL